MSLSPGTRIGHYEILAPIGAGGMGEVFRARDTKLNRDVAIKMLPESVAIDPVRLARFEREARTLATLNHPHIAQIYGLEDGGARGKALVMELVPGQTLAERIADGSLTIPEALEIGRQIADALECAHAEGIVHRDLKPANIKVRDDGTVKVLDFGLAKGGDSGAAPNLQDSPTFTSPAMTERGIILGTAAYMSPEQARGKPVDKRADIWAFGVIVFEMLTGRQMFAGETVSDTLAAVLREDVPWASLPPGTPPALRRVLERCLQKDPKRRLRDIGDAKLDIEDAMAGKDVVPTPAASVPTDRSAGRFPWRALAIVASLAAVAVAAWALAQPAPAPAEASTFLQLTDTAGEESAPAMSPDGTTVVFASRARGSWDLYAQRVGGRTPVLIAGDPARDEKGAAFSPDGQRIAFHEADEDGGVFVAGATGESVRRISPIGFHPAWSADGRQLLFNTEEIQTPYSRQGPSALMVIDAEGGEPRTLDKGDAAQGAWSPSGRRIVFWSNDNGQRDLYTIAAGGGARVPLVIDAPLDWCPVWAPDGRSVVFASDRGGALNLWSIAIDEATGEPQGTPVPMTNGVQAAAECASFSKDGSRFAFRSTVKSVNPVSMAFDPATLEAGPLTVLDSANNILVPAEVSPDGRMMALFNLGAAQEDLFVTPVGSYSPRRITDDAARDRGPVWTPDSQSLVFYSTRSGTWEMWSINIDGGGLRKVIPLANVVSPVISPSFDRIVFTESAPGLTHIAQVVNGVVPAGAIRELPNSRADDATPNFTAWSSDGRTLTGSVIRPSGRIAGVVTYDLASSTLRKVNSDSAEWVRWLPDNRRIIYMTTAGDVVVVDTGTNVRTVVNNLARNAVFSFALAPDGRTLYFGIQRSESDVWIVEKRGDRKP